MNYPFCSGKLLRMSSLAVLLLLSLFLVSGQCVPVPESDEDFYGQDSSKSNENSLPSSDEIIPEKRYSVAHKRALSLLAHWKPYYLSKMENPGTDFVSAVARGGGGTRPLGQPLRWG